MSQQTPATPQQQPQQQQKQTKKSKVQERTDALKNIFEKYEYAPIYQLAEDMLVRAIMLQAGMDKKHKYTFGTRFVTQVEELIERIAWAYQETQNPKLKVGLIKSVLRKVTSVLIKIRCGSRLNIIKGQSHLDFIDNAISIIKQASGWLAKLGENGEGIKFVRH